MELRQLRYVVKVAEEQNFSRAAERCFVAQSALSHQIRRLEDELGVTLFRRTSRHVSLTSAGEAFVPLARKALHAVERAATKAASFATVVDGKLAIGCIPSPPHIDLPQLIADYHRRYPEVEIHLHEELGTPLQRLVQRGDLDAVVVGMPTDKELRGVSRLQLHRDTIVAVVPAGHPLARRSVIRFQDIAHETFIDGVAGAGLREFVDRAFEPYAPERRSQFQVTGPHNVLKLAAQGLGIALLPRGMVSADPEVLTHCRLLEIEDAPSFSSSLLYNPDRLTAAARAFVDLVTAHHGPAGPPTDRDGHPGRTAPFPPSA
ncbi:hypothetical protein AV521_43845 [Streptomyces sp. IMTB 2501]|uniref:LysR family transcriptional regulator n=1 Tax=Streptomyces sp. IMTB 2501 TaxID=1776340 RepID=UPI00096F8D3D|nr:LysR family transcriptional regulator [Streptomyces sp. IMTB 2501]OLZ61268.1 hypothetical protein AV521_43845 [Streptomyces sp. IMTB 2501]